MVKSCKQNLIILFGGNFSCSRLLQVILSLQVSGVVFPYILNLRRNDFQPPIPFISHAAGCIPENGLFTFLMIPASFLGFLLSFLLHLDATRTEDFKRNLHAASFACNVAYFFSWILICSFPFTYTDLPNKYEWICCVLSEHMTGAMLMLGSCVFSPVLQIILKGNSNDKLLKSRIIIVVLVIPNALIGLFSLVSLAFEEVIMKGDNFAQDVIYELPLKLSFYYITTAVCEWILVLSMWYSLEMFSEELSRSTFSICLLNKQLPDKYS